MSDRLDDAALDAIEARATTEHYAANPLSDDVFDLVAALRAEREEVTRLREALGEVVDLRHDRDAAIARAEAAEATLIEAMPAHESYLSNENDRLRRERNGWRSQAEAAEATIAAVRALHSEFWLDCPEGSHYADREHEPLDDHSLWPCPTIRVLDTGATT